jgi:hypothetical protein
MKRRTLRSWFDLVLVARKYLRTIRRRPRPHIPPKPASILAHALIASLCYQSHRSEVAHHREPPAPPTAA